MNCRQIYSQIIITLPPIVHWLLLFSSKQEQDLGAKKGQMYLIVAQRPAHRRAPDSQPPRLRRAPACWHAQSARVCAQGKSSSWSSFGDSRHYLMIWTIRNKTNIWYTQKLREPHLASAKSLTINNFTENIWRRNSFFCRLYSRVWFKQNYGY